MVRSCPGDTGGLLGRLDMAFWRQELMNNTSNLLYRYKKGAQHEVLTPCIALQLGGGRGANRVRHQELQQRTRTSTHSNAVIAKTKWVCTQNLCLCLLAPLEFRSASEKFPLSPKGFIPAHISSSGGRHSSFLGSKSRPVNVRIWNIQTSVSFCHAVLQGWF